MPVPVVAAARMLPLAWPALAPSRFDGACSNGVDAGGRAGSVLIRGERARRVGACRLTNPTDRRGRPAQAFGPVCPGKGGRAVRERVIPLPGAEGGLLVVRKAGWSGFARCR